MTLKERYIKEVRPALAKALGRTNPHALPRLHKIVVNVGVGSQRQVANVVETVQQDLATITGQRPSPRRAKKAIAGFKLRAGEPIGVSVTLRGQRMYDFFERLVRTALPRIRDFRGLSRAGFDGHGNYAFGVREQTVFPEIDTDVVSRFYGMGISIATTAKTDAEAEALLRALGLPLAKPTEAQ
ncbi:50S ribosomal protein L5 [Candidatus Berkelbacteria bacterium]|nr:50S ribosomal protein L5 [Candidatus Berkelbacteria bacterium]